jgi:hypothetical protein
VNHLRRYQRPLLCTEYMSRGNGSFFDPNLAYLKAQGSGRPQLGAGRRQKPDHLPMGFLDLNSTTGSHRCGFMTSFTATAHPTARRKERISRKSRKVKLCLMARTSQAGESREVIG